MSEKIPVLENWYLVTSRNLDDKYDYNILLSKSMLGNPKLKLPRNEDNEIVKVVVGQLGDGRVISLEACQIENGIVFTKGGKKYRFGRMNEQYKKFLTMVKNNVPILYNYVIGQNQKQVFISGNLYENSVITSIIKEEVIQQDFENHFLILKNGKKVFVNWLSINESLIFNLRYKILHGNKKVFYIDKPFCGRKAEIDIFSSEWDFDPYKDEEVFNFPVEKPVLS